MIYIVDTWYSLSLYSKEETKGNENFIYFFLKKLYIYDALIIAHLLGIHGDSSEQETCWLHI